MKLRRLIAQIALVDFPSLLYVISKSTAVLGWIRNFKFHIEKVVQKTSESSHSLSLLLLLLLTEDGSYLLRSDFSFISSFPFTALPGSRGQEAEYSEMSTFSLWFSWQHRLPLLQSNASGMWVAGCRKLH